MTLDLKLRFYLVARKLKKAVECRNKKNFVFDTPAHNPIVAAKSFTDSQTQIFSSLPRVCWNEKKFSICINFFSPLRDSLLRNGILKGIWWKSWGQEEDKEKEKKNVNEICFNETK